MITIIIIVVTCIVSYLAFENSTLFYKLSFDAYQIDKRNEYYRFFTHALVHANWPHLLINMYVLYNFGSLVESYFNYYFENNSILFFSLLYLLSLIFSSLAGYKKNKNNSHHISVGASGAVAAVLFSSVIFSPLNKLYVFGIIPMPAIVFAVLYMGYEYYAGKKSSDNIDHDAHLWGAVFGAVYTIAIKPELGTIFLKQLLG